MIIKYLLETAADKSRTWAAHVRFLSKQYNIPDPLQCLKTEAPSKAEYKEYIQTKISAYYENNMRVKASNSSSMQYFNVSLTGLRGKKHPALLGVVTTHEVKKSRIHLKMLVGDYLTFQTKSNRSGGSPLCRGCPENSPQNESLLHILTECIAYADIRKRMFPEFSEVCRTTKSNIIFEDILDNKTSLCQFILDPASFNLQKRIHINDPVLNKILRISRVYCYTINSARMKMIYKENK